MTDDERAQILKMIETGRISPEEGLKLMQALDEIPADDRVGPEPAGGGSASTSDSRPEFAERLRAFRNLWTLPMWIGVLVTVGGAYLMYAVLNASGLTLWFYCSAVPLLLGVAIVALAFGSRTARWLYINVEQPNGQRPQRIAFGLPLPVGLMSWAVRHFGRYMPDDTRIHTDNVIKAIFEGSALQEPFFVDVREDDGQHVQVYIG